MQFRKLVLTISHRLESSFLIRSNSKKEKLYYFKLRLPLLFSANFVMTLQLPRQKKQTVQA